MDTLLPPERGHYQVTITHDGTRTGAIRAALDYLESSGPEVVDATFLWDGELMTFTKDMVTGRAVQ